MRLTKTYPLTTTGNERFPTVSVTADYKGTFEAIVAVFGNVDYQGDRTLPGSFLGSIERWRKSGKKISVIWSHDWSNPFANVGYVDPLDVRELAPGEKSRAPRGGLFVRGRFDVDKPFARQVYELVRDGRVNEWSFSYDTIRERKASDGANELLELDLIEVGPTLKGANAETLTLSAKTALPMATAEGDRRQVRCTQCGKYQTVPVHPEAIYGEHIYVGMYACCGILFGFSPKSWSKSKWISGMRQVRERHNKTLVSDVMDRIGPLFARFGLFHPDVQRELRDRIASSIQYNEGINREDLASSLHSLVDAHSTLDVKYADFELTARARNGDTVRIGDRVDFVVDGSEMQGRVRGMSPDGTITVTRSHGHRRYLLRAGDVVRVVSTFDRRVDVNPHADNAGLAAQVDQLVAEVRAEKAREDADRKTFESANHALLYGPIDWSAQAERDEELRIRDAADRQRRDYEKAAARDAEALRDEISRTRNWLHGVDAYVENDGAVPDLTERPRPNLDDAFTVTDATFEPEPSFRIPTLPKTDDTYRVVEDDPATTVPKSATPEDKTREVER